MADIIYTDREIETIIGGFQSKIVALSDNGKINIEDAYQISEEYNRAQIQKYIRSEYARLNIPESAAIARIIQFTGEHAKIKDYQFVIKNELRGCIAFDLNLYKKQIELNERRKSIISRGLEICDRCGGYGGHKEWPGFTCFKCEGVGGVSKN